jgi:hypothetical protein
VNGRIPFAEENLSQEAVNSKGASTPGSRKLDPQATRCWNMANWQIITWRIQPARICLTFCGEKEVPSTSFG